MEAEDGSEKGWTEEEWRSEIRKGGGQASRERDATEEEGHAQEWPRRQRREGKEPQTGDCDRPLRSTQEGREGPAEKGREEEQSKKGRSEAIALSRFERCKQIAAVDHPMIDRLFFSAASFAFEIFFPK